MFIEKIKTKLKKRTGKNIEDAHHKDIYGVITSIVNAEIKPHWLETKQIYQTASNKQVYYLSMEFLIGSLLESNLLNCGLLDLSNEAMKKLGFNPSKVYAQEHDAGLGNGGLGRLAACFLDSLASLHYAGHGFGIRYRYGLFEQRMIHGNQIELPDNWLKEPYPWETRCEDEAVVVKFYGKVNLLRKNDGNFEVKHTDTDNVMAIPYDVPIIGYNNKVVNTLRLWSAEPFNDQKHNLSDYDEGYYHGLEHEHTIEQISEYLYPDDSYLEGKELRLKQQYFLVSSSLQNLITDYKKNEESLLKDLPHQIVIQINDTHPSLAIPELMRILMDEESLGWNDAWSITTSIFAYTNHTTLSEALETWPKAMIAHLLPRIYMIIDEINERFCKGIWFDQPALRAQIPRLAIIADEQVHMARLAIVGSFSVNGVAKIHSEILKTKEMKYFYMLYPERFNNKTNGITHRRWLIQANPSLSKLIVEAIGPKWIKQPKELISLLKYTSDHAFLEKVAQVKHNNKQMLAKLIRERTGIVVDVHSIFDVQVKRLHEYKRQLLNIFHIIYLYNELKENPKLDVTPRTFIFAGKAAPSYHLAKDVIKLIHTVATIINHDQSIQGKLKVIFLENYHVSLAQRIIPAVDISEQISTASKEASGTGNMKMMMNGAITLGTLDGANVEISEAVGAENIFIFGLKADEVLSYYQSGNYNARDIYHKDDRIKRVLDQLNQGEFGSHEIEFKDIYYNMLYHNDPYFVLKDFEPYIETHIHVEQAYRDRLRWLKMSVTNIAYAGRFSSDRTIQEYAVDIWKIKQNR
jgi:starch phosphorylase